MKRVYKQKTLDGSPFREYDRLGRVVQGIPRTTADDYVLYIHIDSEDQVDMTADWIQTQVDKFVRTRMRGRLPVALVGEACGFIEFGLAEWTLAKNVVAHTVDDFQSYVNQWSRDRKKAYTVYLSDLIDLADHAIVISYSNKTPGAQNVRTCAERLGKWRRTYTFHDLDDTFE
jgi:hypothetical protein